MFFFVRLRPFDNLYLLNNLQLDDGEDVALPERMLNLLLFDFFINKEFMLSFTWISLSEFGYSSSWEWEVRWKLVYY